MRWTVDGHPHPARGRRQPGRDAAHHGGHAARARVLRRQVRALSAEGRLSAYILIALPVGIFFYMLLLNYDYVSLLWTTLLGHRHDASVASSPWSSASSGCAGRQDRGLTWDCSIVGVAARRRGRRRPRGRALVGSSESTGVARSLELLDQTATQRGRRRPSSAAQDRLLAPIARPDAGLAVRLSPAGTGGADRRDRSTRPGTPPAWTVERIMGAKGARPARRRRARHSSSAGFTLTRPPRRRCGGRRRLLPPRPARLQHRRSSASRSCGRASPTRSTCSPSASRPARASTRRILQVARTVDGPDRRRVRPGALRDPDRQVAGRGLRRARATARRHPRCKTFVSALVQADRLGLPDRRGAARADQGDARRAASEGRGEGAEGHRQDPLPAAAVHLPGPVHRHHRPRRHPDHRGLLKGL